MLTRDEYLKAMGVEVWTFRQTGTDTLVEPVAEPVSPAVARPVVQARPAPPETAETPVVREEPVPEFRLAFLHYESVGLCLLLEKDASLPRRF